MRVTNWPEYEAGLLSQVSPLLDPADGEIARFTADGAYDAKATYEKVLRHSGAAKLIIPPRLTAVQSGDTGPPSQRDRHIMAIAERGRLNWQAATSYGKRALIETIGRYETLIGPRLRARCFAAQQTEVAIVCAVLNRALTSGRPESGRRHNRQP